MSSAQTLQGFAERVLFATTLQDKLVSPGRLADAPTGRPLPTTELPGRPPELRFGRGPSFGAPGTAALDSDRDRGRVLHAFANHELLALELLALAVLRFPEAPEALRRVWVSTLVDEQRHLGAYLDRMRACGVSFGDEPLSRFFWDALSGASDPLAFVCGLSLGLEQANLDFASEWGAAFARAGDSETAGVIQGVYRDEIRHVGHGVTWLARLKDPRSSDWDAWTGALRFPLTPARARGPRLDRAGRRAAGLDEAFVRRLSVTSVSRGRVPRVYLFDPQVEDRLAGRPVRESPVTADLGFLPALLAADDDVVVAPPQRLAFLESRLALGLGVPQIVGRADPALLPGGSGIAVPWGAGPDVARDTAALGGRWDPRWARLYDKNHALGLLRALRPALEGPVLDDDALGRTAGTLAEVEALVAGRDVLVKAGLSTSGGHRIRVRGALSESHRRWVERTLAVGPVRVEPRLDVLAEWSVQLELDADGHRTIGVGRFGASGGAYRGAVLGPWDLGLPPELRRFAHRDGAAPGWLTGTLLRVAEAVAADARSVDFRGALGIDALLVATTLGPRLQPLSEINPRLTMGRLAWALRGRLAPSAVGFWAFLPVPAIAAGFGDPAGLVAAVDESHPPVVADGRVTSGGFTTNDWQTARQVLTLAWVAPTWAGALAAWDRLLDRAADPEPLRRATRWLAVGVTASGR